MFFFVWPRLLRAQNPRAVLLRAALPLGAVLLLSAGCQDHAADAPPGAAPRSARADTVTDALGRRMRLSLPAQRVVSLAPNLTEIVFAAGAGHRLVGVTPPGDVPPTARTIKNVQAYPQVDFEAIAALRPDLVLATDQVNAPRDAAPLETVGAPTYFFSFSSLGDVFDAVETTGRLLGTRQAATRAADSLRRAARALGRRTRQFLRQGPAHRPLVLFLIGDETLYTFSEDSYMHELIRLAGGRSATATLSTDAPLSEAFVLEKKPDVIVGAFGTDYDPARLARLHPSWQGVVPALQHERLYSMEPGLFLRPGPRLVKGARHLARHLHPSLFSDNAKDARPPSAAEAR